MAEWVKRAYVGEDEGFLVYAWLKSYGHSRNGKSQGGHVDGSEDELRYWAEHRPVVETLLRDATTEVICDPERVEYDSGHQAVIWAFACTSGDVVHSVVVKRKVVQVMGRDFAGSLVRDLLGDRLNRACSYTHTIRELARGDWGVKLPVDANDRSKWRVDPTWVARHIFHRMDPKWIAKARAA